MLQPILINFFHAPMLQDEEHTSLSTGYAPASPTSSLFIRNFSAEHSDLELQRRLTKRFSNFSTHSNTWLFFFFFFTKQLSSF